VAFSILAWWILLAPSSSLFPLHHLASHYRPYVAAPFLVFAVVAALSASLPRRLRLPAALLTLALLSAASLSQNARFRTSESLWGHSVAHGGDHLAHLNYAMSLQDRTAPAVREHLQKALALRPDYVFAHINLAVVQVRRGELEAGLAALEQTARRYPTWAEAPYWLGRILAEQKRHTESAAAHARAAAIEPNTLRYQHAAGLAHQLAGRVDASLPYLDTCNALQPDYQDVDFLRGFALQSAGRRDEAIASYRRYLATHPAHLKTHYNLGFALMNAERPAEAIPHFRRCLELQPGYRGAQDHLARCERLTGAPAAKH
jgi:tetratricopeptide (TPR) repeat protein